MKNLIHPPLTDKQASALATQIVKDDGRVRVKFGRTNGRPVLHVYVPGSPISRTIESYGEWENHPSFRAKAKRKAEERASKQTQELIESNRA